MNEHANAKDLASDRNQLVDYLRSRLIGPANGPDECLPGKDQPQSYHYLMGAIFPQGTGVKDIEDAEESDSSSDDPIALAYQMKPASMGLSFFFSPENDEVPEIKVCISAAIYKDLRKNTEPPSGWKRVILTQNPKSEGDDFVLSSQNRKKNGLLLGHVDLVSNWRPLGNGYLVTVSLINAYQASDGKPNSEDILHQAWMRCEGLNGSIGAYPSPNRYSWDTEEEDLALIYQNKKTYAIGHGCAAIWPITRQQRTAKYVETSFMPSYEVPPVTTEMAKEYELEDKDVFSLQFLANSQIDWSKKYVLLRSFIGKYETWIEKQDSQTIPAGLDAAAIRVSERLHETKRRMLKGLVYISENADARECFRIANLVMLMQMVHSSKVFAGELRDANSFEYISPDYFDPNNAIYRWRPFQLAFQLLTIESIANANSEEREITDLIWFPTGGGKTEAYLSVSAFELFHRRMMYGDAGGGTSIMLRYTLRLLTAQQFQRAAALICACELVRKTDPDKWGNEVFSLGLWVGSSTTPNKLSNDSEVSLGAFQKYQLLREQTKPENPFQLGQCPWCGTRIVPSEHTENPDSYGIKASHSSFSFFCPTETCTFHGQIPVQVIDDALYQDPPSFLIGTIDKFARLAWIDEPASFFKGNNEKRRPPSLILQDELHLISGPLGTISGLYESAIDAVIQRYGIKPKYIAATATIRRADDQVKKLYARKCAVFPPSGMTAEDSFFSREEVPSKEKPGRLYIGVMGQYHTPVTSLVHTSAALAQAPIDTPMSCEAKDGYWTQVIYHNSLRELGKTMTMSLDDIPERAAVIAKEKENYRSLSPVELSANVSSNEIPEILENLKVSKGKDGAIDCLPCTNMFSVGVDVKRLGLILINGQPKTTSEYIQASSRVGRDKIPGLVVAFYPNNKARDRSQYESFISYHQALYRAVEPTSVTPYALPSMERALHAALVISCRYCAGLSGNEGARNFNPDDPITRDCIEALRTRMLSAESGDISTQTEISEYLDRCVASWSQESQASQHGSKQLRYDTKKSLNFEPLLRNYIPRSPVKPSVPWATLNSMRNVDSNCNIKIWGDDS